MKKINFSLFFLLILITSCEKEGSHFNNESSSPDLNTSSLAITNQIHPTILESDWWNGLSSVSQTLYGQELSSSDRPVTYDNLMQIKKEKIRKLELESSFSYRGAKCVSPGFPFPNPEGDVVLSSQADVDAFGASGCDEIAGILEINDTISLDPICDLTPLSKLKSIGSSMTIYSSCLTSLDGLEKLKSVGMLGPFGFVGIVGSSLTDIEALSSLKTVTGSINIISCNSLTAISNAFKKITAVESGKTAVSLMSVFVLNINNNTLLTDISGFSKITNLEGSLYIRNNGALTDLDDLLSLSTIGRNIAIENNTLLQNVNRLSVINTISNLLFVENNPALTNCCGLYNLLCSNPPSCTTSGVGGITYIVGNGSGCTEADILAGGACP